MNIESKMKLNLIKIVYIQFESILTQEWLNLNLIKSERRNINLAV